MAGLKEALENIIDVNREAGVKARERLDSLTKPPGSLAVLEEIAVKLAEIQGKPIPEYLDKKAVLVMAGDHGVVEEGVSAFPQEVTLQMVLNFLNGGAAINILSEQAGAEVFVTDIGVKGDILGHPNLKNMKVRQGTRNITKGPAMTMEETIQAVESGIEIAYEKAREGVNMVATGEMGIGNTTSSSAVLAALSDYSVEEVTGRGTGINKDGLKRKQEVIRKALQVNKPDPKKPLEVLQKVGGLEIAALTGVILGSASKRIPVVIDGFISSSAALAACCLKEETCRYVFASHLSQEIGHKLILEQMGLKPILFLNMRLGEGTGAVLTFNLMDAAVKIIREMSTFEEAGVAKK